MSLNDKELIISLTSFPARINVVHKTIETLINQTVKADKIILWLAQAQFPNKEQDLPQDLLNLKEKGLIIDWCEDIRSYKKLIPTLKKYPDSYIVTADDDILYDKNCVKSLVETYKKHPDCIVGHRVHYITFNKDGIELYNNWVKAINYKKASINLFPTGAGAVLYHPNCFYKDILDENLFLNLCKDGDDIWFWAMARLNDKKFKRANKAFSKLNFVDGTQDVGLWQNTNSIGNNDKNLQLMFEKYPQLLDDLEHHSRETMILYNNWYSRIFSIKNLDRKGAKYKVITILGFKIKIKRTR